VAGLGCTATIATDRLKRGEHRVALAVCDSQGLTTYTLALAKGLRSRPEEEQLVDLLLLKTVADFCGVSGYPDLSLTASEQLQQSYEAIDLIDWLVADEIDWLVVWPDGRQATARKWPNLALLSGAFNPLHQGHRQLARVAAQKLQQEIYFELPLVNADKGPIVETAEVRRRVAQFAGVAPLILTRLPLFSQKAQLFPKSVFILGVDTVERLTEPRFYHHSSAEMRAAFDAVAAAGCRFLVAGRQVQGRFITLADIDLLPDYRALFEQIPETEFRVDISSTVIRQVADRK
jgi:nicotinic acid mononucleotide adenylyltransferase